MGESLRFRLTAEALSIANFMRFRLKPKAAS